MPTQKLFCYVDETGQDTRGRLFIVSVIVTADNRDELLHCCEQLERDTQKSKYKWGRAKYHRRLEYLRRVFADPRFYGAMRFSVAGRVTDYDQATILAIAQALAWRKPMHKYTAVIYVDGLAKEKRHAYSGALHRLGIPVRKVQGIKKDENNALTRLADAVAGFVRDVLDGGPGEARTLFDTGKRLGVLVEV